MYAFNCDILAHCVCSHSYALRIQFLQCPLWKSIFALPAWSENNAHISLHSEKQPALSSTMDMSPE